MIAKLDNLTGTPKSGGGSEFNVYWAVGSSATIGTNSAFAGNILALASITLNPGASVSGGLYALNGAVTLDTNTVSACTGCAQATTTATAIPTIGGSMMALMIALPGATAIFAIRRQASGGEA